MAERLKLQALLKTYCDNVYYQPPENVSLKYPCIIYTRSNIDNIVADDDTYCQNICYDITVITLNPDDDIVMNLSRLPRIKFGRHYVSDTLHHDTFSLYF